MSGFIILKSEALLAVDSIRRLMSFLNWWLAMRALAWLCALWNDFSSTSKSLPKIYCYIRRTKSTKPKALTNYRHAIAPHIHNASCSEHLCVQCLSSALKLLLILNTFWNSIPISKVHTIDAFNGYSSEGARLPTTIPIFQRQFVIAYIFRVNCINIHSIYHVFNTFYCNVIC